MKYKWASLYFQSSKEADRVKAETRKGKTIDVGASKLLGHIVFKDGIRGLVDQGASEREHGTGRSREGAERRARRWLQLRDEAPRQAHRGGQGRHYHRTGGAEEGRQYVADPKYAAIKQGRSGAVFPPAYPGAPATTNNPGRAAHSGGGATDYADAQAKVWAEIDGDGLMARYGMSRQAVLAIVNDALRRSGWRK
jgi:hypothetical protein